MKINHVISLFLILLFAVSPALAQTLTASQKKTSALAAVKTAEAITAREMEEYLKFIASDEFEGRATPSRGLNLAAKFLAMNLALWNVKPAGDNGTYFQKFNLRKTKTAPVRTFAEFNGKSYVFGRDLLAAMQSAGQAEAPLVYVGHGWLVKAKNIDAYIGVDVKDKIVVIAGGGFPPREVGGSFPLPGKPGEDWDHPFAYAQKRGAKGVILLPTYRSMTNWERDYRNQSERGMLTLEKPEIPGTKKRVYAYYHSPMVATVGFPMDENYRLPTVSVSSQMAEEIFRGEKNEAGVLLHRTALGSFGDSFDLDPAKKIKLSVGFNTERETTQNVVGIIEGSDPILKNEYVAVGAHYDHVGIGNPVGDDAIYNGADDNGSGTIAILAMAKAMALATARPKRSILFVWHAGEENGLWGSEYFTDNPTVPLSRIVAQLNIDMIGRSRAEGDMTPANKDLSATDEIYVIGSKMMSSELGLLSERVNNSYLKLKFNYKYDDPEDTERFFYRSDHYNYVRKGIPVIFYFNGPHVDYHKPSDSSEKIDFQKIEHVARTVLMTALEIANTEKRPVVDKPLKLN